MKALLQSLIAWVLLCAGCVGQPQDGRVGVLDGYQLFSVAPRSGAKSKPIDIRSRWDESIFFRSSRQLEKQGRTYPFVSIVDASSAQGMFLAVPQGLSYRDDGPLVLANVLTGQVIKVLPVSGSSIRAAFVPPDGRRIISSWMDPDGTLHTALFDTSTARVLRELTERPPDSHGFAFIDTPSGIRFLAAGPQKGPGQHFAALEPGQDASPVPLPTGNFTILDLRGNTMLLESAASVITVSVWDWTHPEGQPVKIQRSEYSGTAVYTILADGGRRVMQWTGNGRTITVYDSFTGRVSARLNLDGPVRAYAVDLRGSKAVFAVNQRMVFVDPSNARILSRSPNVLSMRDDLSLFWFDRKP